MPDNKKYPLHVFKFRIDFYEVGSDSDSPGEKKKLCSGMFAECSGLEATMEPKSINVGGRNFGQTQLAGRVSFATVILKRGVSTGPDLWRWFDLVGGGAYAYRMNVEINLLNIDSSPNDTGVMIWKMENALPVKFKAADLNSKATEIGIEELHFVHEGLSLRTPSQGGNG